MNEAELREALSQLFWLGDSFAVSTEMESVEADRDELIERLVREFNKEAA